VGAVSDHLDELGIGAPPSRHVQLFTQQLAFVLHAAHIVPVHHATGEREALRPTRAVDNFEIKTA